MSRIEVVSHTVIDMILPQEAWVLWPHARERQGQAPGPISVLYSGISTRRMLIPEKVMPQSRYEGLRANKMMALICHQGRHGGNHQCPTPLHAKII
jgi:hypothetical protein